MAQVLDEDDSYGVTDDYVTAMEGRDAFAFEIADEEEEEPAHLMYGNPVRSNTTLVGESY